MGTNTETHSQMLPRVTLGTFSTKWDISTKPLCSEFREFIRRGGGKNLRGRGDKDTKKTMLSKSTWEKFLWTHRDWISMQRACMALHQIPSVYIMASRLVFFWNSQGCKWMGLSFLGLLLELFSFYWFVLSNFNMIICVSSYNFFYI